MRRIPKAYGSLPHDPSFARGMKLYGQMNKGKIYFGSGDEVFEYCMHETGRHVRKAVAMVRGFAAENIRNGFVTSGAAVLHYVDSLGFGLLPDTEEFNAFDEIYRLGYIRQNANMKKAEPPEYRDGLPNPFFRQGRQSR